MTERQIEAAFTSSRNLFVTGPAGTGKSYRLNQFIESQENVIICAPTGIAALHIGGETAHKIFHIPVPAYESPSFAKGKKGALTKSMLNLLIAADVVVIDEISMFKNSDFSFAIKESLNFKVIELTDVKRQSDLEFVTELNKVRIGDFSSYGYFNQFVNEHPDYTNAICICGTNAEADKINNDYLDNLPGMELAFRCTKEGRVPMGFADEVVVLKKGCRVIFTANDNQKNLYKNGSFGYVKDFLDDSAILVTVADRNGNDTDVKVYRNKTSAYSYSATGGNFTKKEIGSVIQYPLRVGKAIMILSRFLYTFSSRNFQAACSNES